MKKLMAMGLMLAILCGSAMAEGGALTKQGASIKTSDSMSPTLSTEASVTYEGMEFFISESEERSGWVAEAIDQIMTLVEEGNPVQAYFQENVLPEECKDMVCLEMEGIYVVGYKSEYGDIQVEFEFPSIGEKAGQEVVLVLGFKNDEMEEPIFMTFKAVVTEDGRLYVTMDQETLSMMEKFSAEQQLLLLFGQEDVE